MKNRNFIIFCKLLGLNLLLYLIISFVMWDILIIKKIPKISYGERSIIATWFLCLNYFFYLFNKKKIIE